MKESSPPNSLVQPFPHLTLAPLRHPPRIRLPARPLCPSRFVPTVASLCLRPSCQPSSSRERHSAWHSASYGRPMMHWPEEQGAATAAGVIHQTITPQKATHIPTLHQASSVIATDALREVRKRRSISRRVIRARPQGKAAEPVRAMSSITWCR